MKNTKEVVIVSAVRTAVGSFGGSLANVNAVELGRTVISAALNYAKLNPHDVSEVILGQVLTAAAGQNVARQSAIAAGIPQEVTAYTVNQVCGSGLRSVALAYQSILVGDSEIVVAGGQENMSLSAHATFVRTGQKMGDLPLIDTMIRDGLWDAFNNYHMGITAENVATKYGITREMQDNFALASQNKAEAAMKSGKFNNEIVPVLLKSKSGETAFIADEYIRSGTTLDKLQLLRSVFKKDGTVTAGNASGLNDGAAALVLMSAKQADKLGLTPLARIASWATAGVDPALMGTGPIPASQLALKKAGWNVQSLDLIEANEAFAAQACAVNQEMRWDPEIVNVNGGAIAIGHPIGASGARILVTLVHEMFKRNAKKGLATLCIGGGMGISLTVER